MAEGYELEMTQTDSVQTFFTIEDPKDENDEMFSLVFATPAWESQGSPQKLHMELYQR